MNICMYVCTIERKIFGRIKITKQASKNLTSEILTPQLVHMCSDVLLIQPSDN